MVNNETFGKLIVFEGADGVGKTTLMKIVWEELSVSGVESVCLSFPGKEDNSLGKLIYNIHHEKKKYGIDDINRLAMQTLHVAAHIDCIEGMILPTLAGGKNILLDRYWWSTLVYGLADGIERSHLEKLIGFEQDVWSGVKPAALFLIHADQPFRKEYSAKKWENISKEYNDLHGLESQKYPVYKIKNSQTVKKIGKSISNIVLDVLRGKNTKQVAPVLQMDKIQPPLTILTDWFPVKTTPVFEAYWRFAAERQNIFFRRAMNQCFSLTKDPVLQEYKFTNAYRASDRVSQYLIKNVIYKGEQTDSGIFFRIMLFKIFNRIGTWELLEDNLGEINYEKGILSKIDEILRRAMEKKHRVFSSAYIMPTRAKEYSSSNKHSNYLMIIDKMMRDELPKKIAGSNSMQEVYEMLRSYPLLGNFLAFQYAIDLNYSTLTDFDEMSFVVPGPGAIDGIRKCFADLAGLSNVDIIKLMADNQEREFSRYGIEFKTLWGRRLQLIDCQNIFCEIDKYSRVMYPQYNGVSGRTRIKQKFRINSTPIMLFYPPKWNINEKIQESLGYKNPR